MKPVALPPGRARLSTKPAPTGSATTGNTIGTVRVACSNGPTVEVPWARMTSGASAANSAACLRMSAALAAAQRVSIRTLRPIGPAQLLPAPAGTPRRGPEIRIVRGCGQEHADAPHALALLRARGERPRSRRAAEQRDEFAPLHSITSSARASSVGGTSRPSALAVLRLITSSYLVGACTGRSAGFSPLRMRST